MSSASLKKTKKKKHEQKISRDVERLMWLDTITVREAANKSPDLSCEVLSVLSGLFCE